MYSDVDFSVALLLGSSNIYTTVFTNTLSMFGVRCLVFVSVTISFSNDSQLYKDAQVLGVVDTWWWKEECTIFVI